MRDAACPISTKGGGGGGGPDAALAADRAARLQVVQLSLNASLDPKLHLKIGRALRELRQEGVLLLGSGSTFHNMQVCRRAAASPCPSSCRHHLVSCDAHPLPSWTRCVPRPVLIGHAASLPPY